jgi:endonuclease/exonuclease/phosphatase family metal-dependent hydrolase
MEREGVPAIDEEAAQIRLRQLDIVLNGIVSRYNRWRRENYPVRDQDPAEARAKKITRDDRHPPLWIIAGDFNFTPDSVEYMTLVRNGFIDLIPSDNPSHRVGTKASGLGNKPTLTNDYVFAGPRFEAIDPRVAEDGIGSNHVEVNEATRVSDHFPLIIEVPIALKS